MAKTYVAKNPYYLAHRERQLAQTKAYQASRPTYTMWLNAKHRAKRFGWEFTIVPEDIVFPEYCPILDLKLDQLGMAHRETSPSIDRIDNSLGYIPGNIQIISMRANRIKAWGTPEELMKIALYANRKL